jgi:hypothetical protein
MNVKIVLSATALAATLAFAAPTLAQNKEPADQTMAAPKHHHGHHAAHHMASGPSAHRRGSTRDVDAREREETARLNQEQLHGTMAPAPAAHPAKGM